MITRPPTRLKWPRSILKTEPLLIFRKKSELHGSAHSSVDESVDESVQRRKSRIFKNKCSV